MQTVADIQTAKRKARGGHRDWVGYGPKDARTFEPLTKDALKRALLSAGTAGRFTLVSASNAALSSIGWKQGVLMLRNIRHILARASQ